MCHYARLARPAWLTATTTCVISALLFGTSSLTAPSASANELRQQGRQHHGGGGGRGFGAVGIGLGIGGMVLDQMQRQRMQQPRAVSSRPEGAKKGGMASGSSAKKKKGNPSVAKKQGVPNVAKKQDDPVPTNRPPEGATPPGNPPTQVATPVPVVQAPPVPGTPPGQNPPPRPPVVQALPSPSTPVSAPPPGGSDPRDKCPDHVAEITNGKRVFHRLFIVGHWKKTPIDEQPFFENAHNVIKNALTAPGRFAQGSSAITLTKPTLPIAELVIQATLMAAQPCEEVTIYLGGHGAGGIQGRELPKNGTESDDELRAEEIHLRPDTDPNHVLSDRNLGAIVKKWLKPNVSLTVIATSCYGGGFAGPGNVEESKLVQVIGITMKCENDTLDRSIATIVKALSEVRDDHVVTAKDVKEHLEVQRWPIGAPDDTAPVQTAQPRSR